MQENEKREKKKKKSKKKKKKKSHHINRSRATAELYTNRYIYQEEDEESKDTL